VKYVKPDADQDTLMRLSRHATIGWGIAQIVVALGAQWIDRSVLDAGLLVLSFAAGPVLGAFLTGVLIPRVGSAPMLLGMIGGTVVVTYVWLTNACAWTWYALVGAAFTCGIAVALSFVMPRRDA
jgi:solute:Na+ symporter, SSS family